MSLQPSHIALVRQSFAQVAPIADSAAGLFYSNLFEADPGLRQLFRGDMQAQGAKLMQMIGAAVGLLDKPEQLMPVLRHLGARHAGYGVQTAHYDTVGAALIKTLGQGLGTAFTDEVKQAWLLVYGVVASTMLAAAAAVQPREGAAMC